MVVGITDEKGARIPIYIEQGRKENVLLATKKAQKLVERQVEVRGGL